MGCAQSMSKRLGSMSLFDVEVFDPATNKEVSFTNLCAAEEQQAAAGSHGNASPRAPALPVSVTHTPGGSSNSSRNLSPPPPSSSDLAAQMRALQSPESDQV